MPNPRGPRPAFESRDAIASRSDATPAPLSGEDIGRVFNSLGEQRRKEREPFDRRRAWIRLQRRMSLAPHTQGEVAHRQGGVALRWVWRQRWLFVAITTVCVVWIAWPAQRQPVPLSFDVTGSATRPSPSRVTTSDGEALVNFSDSSWIRLQKSSDVDIRVLAAHSALARVWQGAFHIRVTPSDATDWRILAGPYEVQVVGTEFELNWDPETERLRVRMLEGKVRVLGPADGNHAEESVLVAGDDVRWEAPPQPAPSASPATPAVQHSADLESEPSERVAPAAVAEEPKSGVNESRRRSVASSDSASDVESASWSQLVAKGEFSTVVNLARAEGLSRTLESRNSQDLKALAQAAGYAGQARLARRAWSELRQRFAGQPVGTQAAFFLGRIEERLGNARKAGQLFDAYLEEAPRGVYASEALGHQLSMASRRGGKTQARHVARRYLAQFPGGAYAKLAQSTLED